MSGCQGDGDGLGVREEGLDCEVDGIGVDCILWESVDRAENLFLVIRRVLKGDCIWMDSSEIELWKSAGWAG